MAPGFRHKLAKQKPFLLAVCWSRRSRSRIQRGEKLRLRIDVKNVGKGVAAKTTALLRSASGDKVVYHFSDCSPFTTRVVAVPAFTSYLLEVY